MTCPWDEIVNCSRVSSVDPELTFTPYRLDSFLIVSIFDPFRLCNIPTETLYMLEQNGFLENKGWESFQDNINIFDDSWLGTKILRFYFTANLYVFTCKDYLTNAIAFIRQEYAEKVIDTCQKLKLCCCIYAPIKLDGYDLININYEERDEFDHKFQKPNHLKVIKSSSHMEFNTLPRDVRWYCRCYRYYCKENLKLDSINWTKRYLQWCWMKFLLPLAANENCINVNELTKSMIRNLEHHIHAEISLKFILNAAKCHPIQLAGVTNIIFYNKELKGNEIPFSNFKYIISESMLQWLHGKGNIQHEILKIWSYPNDWHVNSNQKNLLEALMFSSKQNLDDAEYPNNIATIWKKNMKKIKKRKLQDVQEKFEYVNITLKILDELG